MDEDCLNYITDYHDLYKIAVFVVLVICFSILLAIYFVCPFNRRRKQFIKKKYLSQFYDTQSITTETEFDFKPALKNTTDQQQNNSYITNITGGSNRTVQLKNGTKPCNSFYPKSEPRNASYENSIVSKTSQNGNPKLFPFTNVINEQMKNWVPLLNSHLDMNKVMGMDDGTDSVMRQNSLDGVQSITKQRFSQPHVGKQYSSSQDLPSYFRSKYHQSPPPPLRCSQLSKPQQMFTSVPDFNTLQCSDLPRQRVARKGSMLTPDVQKKYTDPLELTGAAVCDIDTDEGQLQCMMSYDEKKSIIIIEELEVSASFPSGIPGFIVEVHMVPKTKEIVRSKVYVTVHQSISVRLNEIFYLECSRADMTNSSVVISVVPLLGNLILFAETELSEVGYLESQVNLGGFLKGIYTK